MPSPPTGASGCATPRRNPVALNTSRCASLPSPPNWFIVSRLEGGHDANAGFRCEQSNFRLMLRTPYATSPSEMRDGVFSDGPDRSEEHTSELQSPMYLV